MPFLSSLADFMSGIIASLFKGKTSNESRQEITNRAGSRGKNTNSSSHVSTDSGFQKAMTGGLLTRPTVLKNETEEILYLRDKVGAAYGTTRYQIPAKSSMHVTPLQHTFFKMLAYAVEDNKNQETTDDAAGLSQGSKPKTKTSTDTKLTIDSDQLADNSEIRIMCNNGKYELGFTRRS